MSRAEAVNSTLPPRPWSVQGTGGIHMDGTRDAYLVLDAQGRRVAGPCSCETANFIAGLPERCEHAERRLRDAVQLLSEALSFMPNWPNCQMCTLAHDDVGDCFPNGTYPCRVEELVNRIKAFLQEEGIGDAETTDN